MTIPGGLMQFEVSAKGLSDVGRVRKNNEDAFLVDDRLGIFAVADGMGGHQAGEVASAMAIAGLRQRIAAIPAAAPPGESALQSRRQIIGQLVRAVEEINAEIYERGRSDAQARGMGCTLDVMLARDSGVFLAHVGDSRAYGLREGLLYQLTEDHTFGQSMLSNGVLTAEEVLAHPQRNRLMRALGVYPDVQVDTAYLDVAQGDAYMLCSDGVHGLLTAEQIGRAMAAGPTRATQALIKLALAAGGNDNATAIVLRVDSYHRQQQIRVGSEQIRQAMTQSMLFDGFTDSEILRVQKIAIGRVLVPGEVVTRSNELCRELYVVLSGALSGWRGDLQVGSLVSGNPFGEMSLHEAPALITVRADSPASILVFPLHELQLLLKKDTVVAAKLSMNLLRRVYQRFGEIAVVVDSLRTAAAHTLIVEPPAEQLLDNGAKGA